jgi:hypothetical protein
MIFAHDLLDEARFFQKIRVFETQIAIAGDMQ